MFLEAKRRDDIIRDLVSKMNYYVGDICRPFSNEEEDKYGNDIEVRYIADNYAAYGRHNDWPEDDHPKIVSAYSKKTQAEFICTTNYLIKV